MGREDSANENEQIEEFWARYQRASNTVSGVQTIL